MLDISLLNGFALSYNRKPITGFESSRMQGLFAFLVLNRHAPQQRSLLADVFYPNASGSQAYTNLRNLLHLVRKTLPNHPEYFSTNRLTIQWNPNSLFCLDVDRFLDSLNQAQQLIKVGDWESKQALESALDLYTGDLLPEVYYDWLEPYRNRYRQKFIYALCHLLDLLDQLGEWSKAIDYAERLLISDPLNEPVYQRLMRYYLAVGDGSAAVHAYARCRDVFQRELDVQPSHETRDLYEQAVKHQSLPRQPSRPKAQELPLPILPFEEEPPAWKQFQACWQAIRHGSSQILFIESEAGLGKSYFLKKIARWAAEENIVCRFATCYEPDMHLPYAPLINLLRTTLREFISAESLAELADLLPDLHVAQGTASSMSDTFAKYLQHEYGRTMLFEKLCYGFAAGKVPQIFLFDNLHWCDPGTLDWIQYLLRKLPEKQVLLVTTVRPEEALDNPTLGRFKTALARDHTLYSVELAPLTLQEIIQLVQVHLGQILPRQKAAWFYKVSGGNPRYLLQWIGYYERALAESRELLDDVEPPETIMALVNERLALLSPQTRRLLSMAALLGFEFTFEALLKVSQSTVISLANALDELLQRRVIVECSPDRYAFRYLVFQNTVKKELSSAQRHYFRELFARMGRPLESRNAH